MRWPPTPGRATLPAAGQVVARPVWHRLRGTVTRPAAPLRTPDRGWSRLSQSAGGVTLYDVASMAGVSTATVSRVVHGLDRVAPDTRARVLAVIDQLGYVPDGAAQSLSRRRKDVIGLVCVERTSPRLQYDIESMSLLF